MLIGLRVTQKISRESLKKSAFCHLGIVTDPKKSLHTKNHMHTTTTELVALKGIKRNSYIPTAYTIPTVHR